MVNFNDEVNKYLRVYSSEFPHPYWIYLSPSHNCNLDCLMCGVKHVERRVELSSEVIRKVIDEIADWPNDKVLMFTGGEPLLRKDIFELIDYSVSRGIPTEMVSNGTLIEERIAEKIINSGLQNIAISLDGVNSETHDLIRNKKGSYNLVIRAIKNLVAIKSKLGYGPQISVWTTIMNQNIDQLYDIALLAKKIGVECLVYHPVILDQVNMQKTYKGGPLWPTPEKLDILRRQIDKLVSFKRKYGIIAFLHDPYLFIDYYSGRIKRKDWSCIPYVFLSIGPNKEVKICGDSFGNVEKSSIMHLLLSKEAFQQREEMKKCNKPCLQTCWALPEYYSVKKITDKFLKEIKSTDRNTIKEKIIYLRKAENLLQKILFAVRVRGGKYQIREVILSVTNRCNLSCKMCEIPKKSSNEELKTEEVKKIIDSLNILNAKTVVFSGGEPLLRRDIFELLEYFKKKGFEVCITTNGVLLTEEIARRLKEVGIKAINISIEGNEPTHDFLRGEGSFQKAIKGIFNAKMYSLNITIATVITKYNYKSLPYIIRLANRFNIHAVKIQPFSQVFLDTFNAEFYINKKEIPFCRQKIQEFIDLAKRFNITVNPQSYLQKIPEYLAGKKIKSLVYYCPALYTTLAIDAQGNVYPCWGMDESYGNIKNEDLFHIWCGEERDKFLTKINKNGCKGCLMSCYDDIYNRSYFFILIVRYYNMVSKLIVSIIENFLDAVSLAKYRMLKLKYLTNKIEKLQDEIWSYERFSSLHSNI